MTLRGYEAGVRRSAAAGHPVLRDLTANAVNDYIRDAIRRMRRFLAHHNGRALRQEGRVVTQMKTPGLDGKHPAILKARKPEIVRETRRGASSAVEQGTFNPLVEGSNPSPLTRRGCRILLA